MGWSNIQNYLLYTFYVFFQEGLKPPTRTLCTLFVSKKKFVRYPWETPQERGGSYFADQLRFVIQQFLAWQSSHSPRPCRVGWAPLPCLLPWRSCLRCLWLENVVKCWWKEIPTWSILAYCLVVSALTTLQWGWCQPTKKQVWKQIKTKRYRSTAKTVYKQFIPFGEPIESVIQSFCLQRCCLAIRDAQRPTRWYPLAKLKYVGYQWWTDGYIYSQLGKVKPTNKHHWVAPSCRDIMWIQKPLVLVILLW